MIKFNEILQLNEFKTPLTKNYRKISDLDKAVNIALKNCKTYCSNIGNFPIIKRTMHDSFSKDFSIVNPKLEKRVSRDTKNFYTILMDNLPSYSEFPKRSYCLIGETYNQNVALLFSRPYTIVPFDGAKFGIANDTSDLWSSFFGTLHEFNISSLSIFSNGINDLYISIKNEFLNQHNYEILNQHNYEILSNQLNSVTYKIVEEFLKQKCYFKNGEWYDKENNALMEVNKQAVLKMFLSLKPKNLFLFFEYVLDPIKNGIHCLDYADFKIAPTMCEVWTDSKCLMIKTNMLQDFNYKILHT